MIYMPFLRPVYLLTLLAVAFTVGCVDIEGPTPPALKPNEILAELNFSSRAVMLSADDTMEMSVRAIAMDGAEIPVNRRNITWSSLDSALVYIDTLGRISARISETDEPVGINASYTLNGVTRFDTISVHVTPLRSNITSVRLVSLDSTFVGDIEPSVAIQSPRVRVDLYNGETLVIPGARLPITLPEQIVASYYPAGPDGPGGYSISNPITYLGDFWVRVSINLYGNEVHDSLLFKGIYPSLGSFIGIGIIEGVMNEAEMGPNDPVPAIQPCGWTLITLINMDRPVDVVFSDSTADENGCDPIPAALIEAGWAGNFPFSGTLNSGNALGLTMSGPLPFAWWIRRSNTIGEISWYIRDAVTGERLPASGRYNQAVPQ